MAISLWWQEKAKKPRRQLQRAPERKEAPPRDAELGRDGEGEADAAPRPGAAPPAAEPWHSVAARRAALCLRLVDPARPHVFIRDQAACWDGCAQECTFLCPAGVFEPGVDAEGRAFIAVRYHLCVECAACRIFCGRDNIEMDYPAGGYGIIHRYG